MILPKDYVSGFVDGEGCFGLTVRRDVRHERKSKAVYYSWKAAFIICLRSDDYDLLKSIKETLGCGTVLFSKNKTIVYYKVSDLFDLDRYVIPFFIKNRLYGKKGYDFKLWSSAVKILLKYRKLKGRVNIQKGTKGFSSIKWKEGDKERLLELQREIREYKSNKPNQNKWIGMPLGRE